MKEKMIYGVKVRLKSESKLMKFFAFLLKPFNKEFMTLYWTTFNGVAYAPLVFEKYIDNEEHHVQHKELLEHEKIHINDSKKYHVWFFFTYLFPPVFLAYGRFHWERKAYLGELLNLAERGDYNRFYFRLNRIVDILGGPQYLWTWPKPWIRKWFLKKCGVKDVFK